MKIKHLISKLNKLNPEAEIIISSDAEGNRYNTINQLVDNLKYIEYGEISVFSFEDISEDSQDFPSQKDYNKAKGCIVLYPN